MKKRILSGILAMSVILCGGDFSGCEKSENIISASAASSYFQKGDVNGDGKADAIDASLILSVYTNESSGQSSGIYDFQRDAADADDNGVIDAIDASLVLAYYVYISSGNKEISVSEYILAQKEAQKEESIMQSLVLPEVSLATKNNAVDISWTECEGVTGYDVYKYDAETGEETILQTVADSSVTKITDTNVTNYACYGYAVIPYIDYNGKKYTGEGFNAKYSNSAESRLNAAVLTPRTSFNVYNCQGAETTLGWKVSLSANDIKILDKFAAENFTDSMTQEQKLRITLNWINMNVLYAEGDDWDEIVNESWVSAIFVHKKGQCAQYNGAMASMMAYMGYDASIIQGYRTSGQHFWCEVNIDGLTYIMEAGNDGRYSGWYYFLAPYSETRGYIKNPQS